MKTTKKMMIIMLILMITLSTLFACSNDETIEKNIDERNLTAQQYSLMNLVGTDDLGRRIEIADNQKADKPRYVGIFYSVWLGQHPEAQEAIYNISELLETEEGTNKLFDVKGSKDSKTDDFHFWGEPLYGFYNSSDPWVLTRHIELLTNAGIDYLCFDTTNNKVYKNSITPLLDLLLIFQAQGFDVPKIVFYTNSFSGDTVDVIYSEYYQTEKYQSLWFQPNGKPLIMGITENNNNASDQTKYFDNFTSYISKEMQEFFEVKESEWPNGDYHPNSVPWMSWEYPQNIHSGSIAVPLAQHSHSRIIASLMDPESSRGYNNVNKTVESDFRSGRSFQDMWDTVHFNDDKVDNVLVTGFNEWMAIKLIINGKVSFVDVYNEEYSRDTEMMKGGYNDNFYMQLVSNIRKYKFTEGKKYTHKLTNIDIEDPNSLLLWDFVEAQYKDFTGDAMPRNHINAAHNFTYTDYSNRNDITDIKVTHDKNNLHFYVKTLNPITEHNKTDLNWMNILISTDQTSPSFAGYQYIINRKPGATTTSLEKSIGGYLFESVGDVKYIIKGNIMQVSIPLSMIGQNSENISFEFKVADNVTYYDDIMDYYVTGDVAPLGRLNFGY